MVIFQDIPSRGPPPDEDLVPEDGNPHPRPPEQFHHPNQNIFVVGPMAFHLIQQDNAQENNVDMEGPQEEEG